MKKVYLLALLVFVIIIAATYVSMGGNIYSR